MEKCIVTIMELNALNRQKAIQEIKTELKKEYFDKIYLPSKELFAVDFQRNTGIKYEPSLFEINFNDNEPHISDWGVLSIDDIDIDFILNSNGFDYFTVDDISVKYLCQDTMQKEIVKNKIKFYLPSDNENDEKICEFYSMQLTAYINDKFNELATTIYNEYCYFTSNKNAINVSLLRDYKYEIDGTRYY